MPSLADIQQKLRHWITAPEGVEAALCQSGDPKATGLRAVVREDGRLSAVDRLSVYANAYFERLCGCLENDYEALRWALGEHWFRDLVTSYLLAHPPTHPSIRHAGRHLANFLGNEGGEPFRRGRPWVADLARFEWALAAAFDAADGPTLVRADLACVAPEQFGELRFALHPSVQALALDWPVQRVRRAWREAGAGESRDALPAELALASEVVPTVVWRSGERVFQRRLEPLPFELIGRVAGGETFGALCTRIAEESGDEGAPHLAAAWLGDWIDSGWIERHLP